MIRVSPHFPTLILILCLSQAPAPSALSASPYRPFPIQSEERRELTRAYALAHYGVDDWRLADPRMIIMHYTATDSESISLSTFKPPRLGSGRSDIASGGELNVGVHYLIGKDGTIWSLLPESAMGRHAVGFNHLAIGIEMVAATAKGLTAAQLGAAARLVSDIVRRNPSIAYLFGHHEYRQASRAHFALYRELQAGYLPPEKSDPGPAFMAALRETLKNDFELSLRD
jgi:N-acetylmuramoyl-L-alanine amidase